MITAASVQAAAEALALVSKSGLSPEKFATAMRNNGSNSATVTQSGDPSNTEKRIETRPGYTSIEQHSGGNSATIIQRSKPGSPDAAESETGKNPNTQMPPGGTDGDDDRNPSLTDADVYRQVRKGASPQS